MAKFAALFFLIFIFVIAIFNFYQHTADEVKTVGKGDNNSECVTTTKGIGPTSKHCYQDDQAN